MKNFLVLLIGILCFTSVYSQKKKGKEKKDKEPVTTNYDQPDAVADTASRFTGVIKYRMTNDDPASNDSMFIIFGDNKIRVVMFYPGYKETDIFRDNFIANFQDSTFIVMDDRKKTYKTEKLGARNQTTEINLLNHRKTGKVMTYICPEFSGDMTMGENDTYEAAALISKQHSFINAEDYNFMNIQPVVLDYKIVLGFRTKSTDNENTFILAYKIEPGNTDSWFDLTGYKAQ